MEIQDSLLALNFNKGLGTITSVDNFWPILLHKQEFSGGKIELYKHIQEIVPH